jgi:hypothetical protein
MNINELSGLLEKTWGISTFDLIELVIKKTTNLVHNIITDKNLSYEQKLEKLKYYYLNTYYMYSTADNSYVWIIRRLIIKMELEQMGEMGNKEAKKLYNDLKNDKDIKEKSEIYDELEFGINGVNKIYLNKDVNKDYLNTFYLMVEEIKITEKMTKKTILDNSLSFEEKYSIIEDLYLATFRDIKLDGVFSYLSLLKRASITNQVRLLDKYKIKDAEKLHKWLIEIDKNLEDLNHQTSEILKVCEEIIKDLNNIEEIIFYIVLNNDLTFDYKYKVLKDLFLTGFESEKNQKKDFFYVFRRAAMLNHLRLISKGKDNEAKELYDALMNDKEVLEKLSISYWY